jgi:hypothetical protein
MAHQNEEKYSKAKDLFVKGGCTQAQCASLCSVSKQTVNKWARENSWSSLRASMHLSIDSLIPKILTEIDKQISAGTITADSMAKYCRQLRSLKEGALSIADYNQVMCKYIDFVLSLPLSKELTPELIKTINRTQSDFLRSLSID